MNINSSRSFFPFGGWGQQPQPGASILLELASRNMAAILPNAEFLRVFGLSEEQLNEAAIISIKAAKALIRNLENEQT